MNRGVFAERAHGSTQAMNLRTGCRNRDNGELACDGHEPAGRFKLRERPYMPVQEVPGAPKCRIAGNSESASRVDFDGNATEIKSLLARLTLRGVQQDSRCEVRHSKAVLGGASPFRIDR